MKNLLIYGLLAGLAYVILSPKKAEAKKEEQPSGKPKPNKIPPRTAFNPPAGLVVQGASRQAIIDLPAHLQPPQSDIAAFDGVQGFNPKGIGKLYKCYDSERSVTVSPNRVKVTFQK